MEDHCLLIQHDPYYGLFCESEITSETKDTNFYVAMGIYQGFGVMK